MDYSATTHVTSTIIAYSCAGSNCSDEITSSIYSISSDFSYAPLLKIEPLLTALGNHGGPSTGRGHDPMQVHMLKSFRPAIDAAPGSATLNSDQRGLPRPPDGSYDIGAVERHPTDSDLAPRLYLPLIMG